MESVLGRYRNLIILVGVLFLQVLGLATQVKRGGNGNGNDPEDTRLIRVWAVGAITPFERVLVSVTPGAEQATHLAGRRGFGLIFARYGWLFHGPPRGNHSPFTSVPSIKLIRP